MTLRFLLDTNICIYIRQKRPVVLERFRALLPGEVAVSVITYGELVYGTEKSRDPELARVTVQNLIRAIPVLQMPVSTADRYGNIRAYLEAQGRIISSNDLWIAAHALASGLTLVTNNEREFRRVEGLRVENWAAAQRG